MRYKFVLLPFKKTFYITSLSFGTTTSLDSRKLGQKEGKELDHALTKVLPAHDACAHMCLEEQNTQHVKFSSYFGSFVIS